MSTKLAIGSDERRPVTDFVVSWLKAKGFKVKLFGALKGENLSWVEVGQEVAEKVSNGDCSEGILFCWTGTGVSIVANKVPGIRAALCCDAVTASGARRWNHANILVMSLRLTSEPVAEEILNAWFSTAFGANEDADNVAKLTGVEQKYAKKIAKKQGKI